jgi:hypothetical protein
MERARNYSHLTAAPAGFWRKFQRRQQPDSSNSLLVAILIVFSIMLLGRILFTLMGFDSAAHAQVSTEEQKTGRAFGLPDPVGDCTVTFCTKDPRKILVHVDDKMLPVRGVEYLLADFSRLPLVKCTLYEGPFAPTTPRVEVFTAVAVKVVDEVEFQTLVDNAFRDPAGSNLIPRSPPPAGLEDTDILPLVPEKSDPPAKPAGSDPK